MLPRSWAGIPVTASSVVIGTAMAPNATGAVFATSDTVAASSGRIPIATSMAALSSTGVPKPASASIRAPKQNAIRMACTRWSSLTRVNERRSTSEWPLSTVMW